ncbi:HAD-like domain-containing protein [Entophlyctis helioformis]|nr:HAD-like domain-containing protein [Entophlyctis helioformis]
MPTEKDTGKDDESYLTGHNRRVAAYWTDTYEYWINPPSKKLLPDPLPAPYHRPYTILIELTDAMTHLVWDREVGWRAAVRPGVKHFLANIGRHFEIVMFTTSPHHLADPIVNALDPYGYIMYRLYREHTKLVDGKYVKDLTLLNRDLGKVIVLDTNPESYSLNPENGLHLNKWQGTAGDDEFERLEDFFEELSTMLNLLHTDDVRPLLGVLRKYDPEDPAGAWVKHKNLLRAEFERSAKAERAKTQASAAAASTTAAPSGSGSSSTGAAILLAVGSFVGTLAGKNRATGLMAGAGGQAPAAQTQQPTNFIDLIEQYAREDRKDFEKHYEEQIRQMEAARKEQEDAMRKQMEAMKSQKLTLMDYMSGAAQPPVPGQQPPQQQ